MLRRNARHVLTIQITPLQGHFHSASRVILHARGVGPSLAQDLYMQSSLNLTILSFLAAAATVVACSSTTTTSSGGDDPPATSGKDSGTSKGTTTGSSGSSGSSGTTGDAGDTDTTESGAAMDCSTTTDAESCFTCCYNIAPADVDVAEKAYDDCQCAAATCATACADSYCGSDPNAKVTTACGTCLDNNDSACGMKYDAACTSAGCQAATQCSATNCAKYNSGM